MKTSVTFLKSKYDRSSTIEKIMETDTEYIHIDIMDGIFVDRTVLSIEETRELFLNSQKKLDIHLMCEKPREYIEALSDLNVEYFTIHAEIKENVKELISYIHSLGINAGLAIKLETTIEDVRDYLDSVENILIMGVNPGYGGQPLTLSAVNKIHELKECRERYNYHYQISLDGGVNSDTRSLLGDLDIIVAGSYICESDDYQAKINTLR
jgi:ribulose-phosphate 3-epimerase